MKPVDFTIYWKETPVVQVCYDAMKQPQFTVLDHSHLPVLLFGMDGKAVPTAARLDKFQRAARHRRTDALPAQANLPQDTRHCRS